MSEGELIIGNCKLQTCLATGNQTQVWEVVEQGSNEKYAMKLLLPEAFKDAAQKAALKHEAKVLESLDHPNIVKFKSLVLDKKQGFLLMELFRAPNLKSQAQTDLLSVHVRLKRLVEQVSQAMAHIHDKGWLHKDLKPDNILFSKAAELRVIDFSLSSKMVTGMAALFQGKKKVIQGTRTYMAPEQIRGMKLGPYTDIYNFGVTLFELLTGRTPFAGFTPNDLLKRHISEPAPAPSMYNENVTPEMDRVVLKMLAKKVDARQKSFNELLAEIRNVTLFKEPPEKLIEQRVIDKENEGLKEASLNDRRDSRSDAKRAELAKAEATAAAAAPPAPPNPIRIPVPNPAVGGPSPTLPPGMVPPGVQPPRPGAIPPGAVPPGVVAGRPPRSIPVGAPLRPGMPPGPLPPGVRPPQMPPGGMPLPPGAMPVRPGMPPPGGPRPPGAPLPPGVAPPGMPPRPGVPAVAAGGPPAGGPPRPLPPGMPPNAPRPGMPPGVRPPGPGLPRAPMPGMPPGQPPRPGTPLPGPGGVLPPGVRPPGPVPPGGGPRPPGAPPPRPAPPPQPAPPAEEASLDDFQIN